MNRYPSPCLKCRRKDASGNCGEYKRCDRYRSWIRWHWTQFRKYYQMEQPSLFDLMEQDIYGNEVNKYET